MTRRPLALVLSLVLTASLVASTTGAALAQEDADLQQQVGAGEAVVEGPATLELGHVDLGPRIVDGDWKVLIRDDAVIPSVWRDLDDAVIRVRDAAVRPVPDDPTYAFLGAEPGTPVHLVPQIQDPDVVWLGWNTQDPEVMAAIDRGVTLTLRGVQGPGRLTVYLQAGNLSEPEVLWTSSDPAGQDLWVDVNTHTHANWVFTAPGTYLVEVEAAATLITGEEVTDTQVLRFAVGDGTSIDETRAVTYVRPDGAGPVEDDAEPAPDAEASASEGPPALVLLLGAGALAAAVAAVAVRSRRIRTRALAERRPGGG